MHEIGILNEAIKTVKDIASKNGIGHIKSITFEVGELSGYIPVFFEQYFPVVTEGDDLFKDCELKLVSVKAEALCEECHTLYNVVKNEGRCPKCHSRSKKILGGQEFIIKNIGY